MKEYPFFISSKERYSSEKINIINPYDGGTIGTQCLAGTDDIKEVLENIDSSFQKSRKTSILDRKEAISYIMNRLKNDRSEIAKIISLEAGKPVSDARVEVDRAINVFSHCLGLCENIRGEIIDLSSNPGSESRIGYVYYVPVGPMLAITPFNFPLNLAVHKIAPAIALGLPVIHRPSSKTPVTGYYLAKIISGAGLCDYFYSFLPCRSNEVDKIIKSGRIKKLSFTGSPQTGWMLKEKACRLKTTLELGGNASCIVSRDTDIDLAVTKCLRGAFSYSGQVCISIQKIHVQKGVFDEFSEKFKKGARMLKWGDPMCDDTVIGPVIDLDAVNRIKGFIDDALGKGAEFILKPEYHGSIITPFILGNTNREMDIERKELFGPGVTLNPYESIDEAIDIINSSAYGLQAGIFSSNSREIDHVFDSIEIGGLIVNDIPAFRSDSMPYGGVKDSGFGREGIMYAAREMVEPKLMVINRI